MTCQFLRRAQMIALTLMTALCATTSVAQETKPAAPPAPPAEQELRYEYALLETTKGNILIQLDRARAPISVRNFLKYVNDSWH